jgi:hypothetical protein
MAEACCLPRDAMMMMMVVSVQQRFKVFGIKMLREMFGPKKD